MPGRNNNHIPRSLRRRRPSRLWLFLQDPTGCYNAYPAAPVNPFPAHTDTTHEGLVSELY
jgi:hypothetical protein